MPDTKTTQDQQKTIKSLAAPLPDDVVMPYTAHATALMHTQDAVRAELALATWEPVLMIQPSTGTTFIAAQIAHKNMPWKKGVRLFTEELQESAHEILEQLMSGNSNFVLSAARMEWDDLWNYVVENSADVAQMRNPDYKQPSEQSRIILT
jgi:uncharacterized protein YeaO (DUF488 family)